ncbi:cysteine desulfurase family protein [Mucisphaera calidilacus]|uniref:cysteine desulfurase n=1 Tax=Mucisphaera calidilacus TaxID=2527982 RepID=A0A518C0E4_9BACT|nr:cysteine desulfurase family protein [Mucisphaera calidilacus]QDU72701.1 Cysteine desulfurase [Mucisphaera calidilacus]
MDWIYLDNNATTQPLPEVVEAVNQAHQKLWANPSSVHRFGQTVRQQIELARADVANLIGASPREIIFTSGGTESSNLALNGLWRHGWRRVLITTRTEHAATHQPAEQLANQGVNTLYVDVDADGVIQAESLLESLDRIKHDHANSLDEGADGTVVIVSLQYANNETGIVQPVSSIGHLIAHTRDDYKKNGQNVAIYLHVDGTQAVGKLPVAIKETGCDLMTFSGHKFHGPKGIGGLYLRRGVPLRPQTLGGPQEQDRRGGTENVPGILGIAAAARAARQFVDDLEAIEQHRTLRDRFEHNLLEKIPEAVIHGMHRTRLWNTTSVAFTGIEAEAILIGLSEKGVCASAGAACSSGSLEPSPVLLAMGMPEPLAHGTIRLSASRFTTQDELNTATQHLVSVVQRLGATMPMSP